MKMPPPTKAFTAYRPPQYAPEEMKNRSLTWLEEMAQRRSCRHFADQEPPEEVIQAALATAVTAPSGFNAQPWTFVAVKNPLIKAQIRQQAEEEEYNYYHRRMEGDLPEEVQKMGTSWHKPYLEEAPWLIAVFKQLFGCRQGMRDSYHHVEESVGIATGMLISALQHAGLATLIHRPASMQFLAEILNRPEREAPFLLIPVGFPAAEAIVPNLQSKPFRDTCVFIK